MSQKFEFSPLRSLMGSLLIAAVALAHPALAQALEAGASIDGSKAFRWENSDSCSTRESRQGPISSAVEFSRCADTTISFTQPPSTGLGGWNGFCGPTAAANITAMRCSGGAITVMEANSFASDPTPGWHPDTLVAALNRIFATYRAGRPSHGGISCPEGNWKRITVYSAAQFLDELKASLLPMPDRGSIVRLRDGREKVRISPTPILIQDGPTGMHWVTVVDFTPESSDRFGCSVFVNTYAQQKRMTCQQMVDQANTLLGYVQIRLR